MNNIFTKSKFIKRVGYLSLSSLISQVITLVNFAIIARIFLQDVIGTYSVFLAYNSIFTSIILLAYQYSLPNLDDKKCRALTYGILVVMCFMASFISTLLAISGYNYLFEMFLINISCGFILLTDMLNIRDQRIIFIAIKKIFNSFALTVLLFSIYFLDLDKKSDILIQSAVIVNMLIATLYSFSSLKKHLFPLPSLEEIRDTLIELRKDPFFLAPSNLINVMTYNLPVILIEKYFGSSMAAQYNMVLKFCVAPISLIGDSIANIYHSSAGVSVRMQDIAGYENFKKLKKYMLLISFSVMVGIITLFPMIIRIVLGDGWEYTARFAQILAPMYGIMLYITPISMLFFVFNEQKFLLMIQSVYIVISLVSFGIAIYLSNIWVGVILFSVLSVIRYIFINLKINSVSNKLRVINV